MSAIPASSKAPITQIDISPDDGASDADQVAQEDAAAETTPAGASSFTKVTAHFSVRCSACLPGAARETMLATMREVIARCDPNREYRKWGVSMANKPSSLMAKKLAPWVRTNLFMSGDDEVVPLDVTTELTREESYQIVQDPVTGKCYIVCVHTLGLTDSAGQPVTFEFDPDYPDAELQLTVQGTFEVPCP